MKRKLSVLLILMTVLALFGCPHPRKSMLAVSEPISQEWFRIEDAIPANAPAEEIAIRDKISAKVRLLWSTEESISKGEDVITSLLPILSDIQGLIPELSKFLNTASFEAAVKDKVTKTGGQQ